MSVHDEWPSDLYLKIDKLKQKMQSYGYVTDYEEMFEQVGLAVLICQHKAAQHTLNIMGMSILAELMYLDYPERKKEVMAFAKLYASYFRSKKAKAEARKVSRKKIKRKG
jgi:hypothetical protein